MALLRKLMSGLRALFLKKQVEQEMDEELRGYLDAAVQDKMRAGMGPEEALRAARVEMGSVEAVKDEIRSAGWESALETLWQDVRYGLRMLRKNAGFTAVAALTLALGIGANTAIFSVVYAALLRPLPFSHAERLCLVSVSSDFAQFPVIPATLLNFRAWHDHNRTLERIGAFLPDYDLAITGSGEAEKLRGAAVSEDFFPTLGVTPVQGRFFTADEVQPGKDGVVLLSYGLWQRRLGGDRAMIGKQVTLDARPYTVIGVVPAGFHFIPAGDAEFWIPVSIEQPAPGKEGRKWYLNTLARLKPGVTLAQARADLDALTVASSPDKPHHAIVRRLDEDIVKDARRALLILVGAVTFVLLVACTNVAILQLSRSMARSSEIAVRLAIGAGRWRVIRQLLVESGMLAMAGGLLGIFLAWCSVGLLVKLGATEVPRSNEISINLWVLAFTAGTSLLSGVLFGMVPAIRTSTPNLSLCLKEGGAATGSSPRQDRVLGMLVAGQLALALTLLTGAGLMINTLWRLLHANPGFATEKLLTMEVDLPWRKYRLARAEEFRRSVLERVASLHGVEAAAFSNTIPMGGWETRSGFLPNGKPLPGEFPGAPCQLRIISPDYFRTLKIPLLEGRFFTNGDVDGKPRVAIVNDALARRYFEGQALGQHISQGPGEPLIEIVGVTADIRFSKLSSEPLPTVYYPYAQEMQGWHMLAVRTSGDPAILIADVRKAIQGLDPDVPASDVMTMEQRVSRSLGTSSFLLFLLTTFAAIALTLAGVGVYGAMGYAVTRRTHEIGIRMALGAGKEDVLNSIMKRGALPTVAGVGIGLTGALALTRILSSFLYGVTTTDPATYASVAVLLGVVAMLACWLPARRAAKIDPIVALRYE